MEAMTHLWMIFPANETSIYGWDFPWLCESQPDGTSEAFDPSPGAQGPHFRSKVGGVPPLLQGREQKNWALGKPRVGLVGLFCCVKHEIYHLRELLGIIMTNYIYIYYIKHCQTYGMMNRMEPKHGMGSNVGSWLVCAPP